VNWRSWPQEGKKLGYENLLEDPDSILSEKEKLWRIEMSFDAFDVSRPPLGCDGADLYLL